MEQSKIDMFVMANKDAFTISQLSMIKDKLASMSDDKFALVCGASYQNATTVLIISILFGELGVDRFMLGEIGLGILKLITCGGCGIWWLIDLFNIKKKTYDYNFSKFNEAAFF